MSTDNPDLDAILAALGGDKGSSEGGGGNNMMLQMMMLQMERDRSDRASSRQTTMQLVVTLAPLVLPMLLGKKEADPIMMTLLSGLMNKNNDGEQLKSFMQMMSAASHMSMEQMKTSMLGIMELKDQQTRKMLEDRDERDEGGGESGGPAGIMREIRLGLSSLAPMLVSAPAEQPALPAPAASGAAANPGQPARPPTLPIVVVLHQLAAIQSGKVKQTPATWAALATVALQDPQMIAALDDCTDDDLSPLLGYCQPHVMAAPNLLKWIQAPGVAQWVDDTVRRRLMPMIDAARDDGEDEPAESGNHASTDEPEELQPPDDAAEGTG